jgi:hypothetical protein
MDRSNPYEAAFEKYLTARGLCYVGVDEKKRSLLGDAPVKNLDFIVLGQGGARLLVDVKGRQFPSGPPGRERYVWHNWSTQLDIDGMTSWTQLFGPGYLALFVFMYKIGPTVAFDEEPPDLWTWQETRYLLRGVSVDDYRQNMRPRSRRWGTVCLPNQVFRRLARPFRHFSHECADRPAGAHAHEPAQDRPVPEVAPLALAACPPGGTESGRPWR